MKYLKWLPMDDIPYGCADRIILRITEGDSEWIQDCAKKNYRLIVKRSAWQSAQDFSDKILDIPGKIEDTTEPGRIVFELSEKDTKLNLKKKAYYCQIIESNKSGEPAPKTVFMGYFKVRLMGVKGKANE